jgi:hypothetical protein
MGAIWVGSWFAQSVTGLTDYHTERPDHQQDAVSWGEYLTRPGLWKKRGRTGSRSSWRLGR